jgi:auxin efflux carrier family
MTMVAMGLKFLVGPALMAVASIVIGLRDTTLKVAIVQVMFLSFLLLIFR